MRSAVVVMVVSIVGLPGCGGGSSAPDGAAPVADAGADAAAADAGADASIEPCGPVHVDDAPVPEIAECPVPLAPGTRDLLDEVRSLAGGRDELLWTEADWASTGYLPVLPNAFLLPAYAETHDRPERAICFADAAAGRLDALSASGHVASRAIAEAAQQLGLAIETSEAPVDAGPCDAPLARAAVALARAAGGEPEEDDVVEDASDVPFALQTTVAPILVAMQEVVAARSAAVDALGPIGAEDVALNAPDLTGIGSIAAARWITSRTVQDEVAGPWRTALIEAAHRVAVAVDHARPALAAGGFGEGFSFDLDTPLGSVRVRDDAAHVHELDLEPVALLVDTGGDDVWLGSAGATALLPGQLLTVPVAIAIDAGGADRYGYEEFPGPYDGVARRPPADAWGRIPAGEGPYCTLDPQGLQFYGPVTTSREVRQGTGVFGVGMLVDLGGGPDRYTSLRRSQGYGAAGVGLLLDDGGDDHYLLESEGQGGATLGIGLLVDLGGSDEYSSYVQSQGFGNVGGVGMLLDGAGDDQYLCDHGVAAEGGDPMYCSPQLPGDGNSSMCQGAGFGLRGDTRDPPTFLAGGLGVLRDTAGSDRYEASVFAQGTGYWQGVGLLSDGGGDDVYDARWYVQGAAAHYAVGILTDAGGDDRFNHRRWTVGGAVGSGHDYSVGLLVDESGDDEYFGQGNALGAGNCNGIGLLVDNGGADRWVSTTRDSLGHAHVSAECEARGAALTAAVFLDAAGTDVYERPEGEPVAADGAGFAQSSGRDGEVGAFLDAPDGDTRMHVTSE